MNMVWEIPPIVLTRKDHGRLSALAAGAIEHMPGVGRLLAGELTRARLVDQREIPATVVTMNSRVAFKDNRSGQLYTAALVYPGQADIAEGRLSILTTTGAALLGMAEGQTIEWQTRSGIRRSLTVVKVHDQPEASGHFDL
jgi:regulator of nucleoside diphosphate kinase